MNILETLQKEHSKKVSMAVANWIDNDAKRFAALIAIILGNEKDIANRAAWVLPSINNQYIDALIQPHLKQLIPLLGKPVHDGIKRNIVRLLQFTSIPQKLQGITLEHCFQLLNNPKEAIAIRVFAMTVLYNITLKEPDLANELYDCIEMYMEGALPAYKSRGGKILKALSKLK
ncbi:MAG: hypothetical protein V4643_03075 [Bacteroidota bacterium]